MLKKAINRWAFPSEMPVDQCIDIAKEHDFDGIELNLEEAGDFSLDTTNAEVSKIKQLSKEADLEICSVCSLLFWKYPITSSNPKIRDKGIDTIRKMVDFAEILEIQNLLVVPGMVHADPPLDFGNTPVSYKQAWERAKKHLGELADYAKPKGVVLGLENVFYNKFLLTPIEFELFFKELGRDNVKLYFDVGNTMLCGFPEDWIGHLKEYICSFHMKDFDKNINTLYGWKNIFQGHINWDLVTKAIKDMAYEGYLVGEPSLTPFAFEPIELVKTTSSALSRVIEMIARA